MRPPPIMSTFSLTMSSWIRRFPVSPDEASSLTISSICLSGHDVAVLLHVEAGAGDYLLARCRQCAGHRHYHADLDRILRVGGPAAAAIMPNIAMVWAIHLLNMAVLRWRRRGCFRGRALLQTISELKLPVELLPAIGCSLKVRFLASL